MADQDDQGDQDGGALRGLRAALRASEARYQAIFQGARDAIFVADASGRLLDANRAALRMLDRTIEEVRSMSFAALHPPEELETARAAFAAHLRQPDTDFDQLHVLRRDGSRIPIEIGSALAEVDGHVLNIGTFRDLTRRESVSRSLRFQLSLQQAITRIAASLVEVSVQTFDAAIEEALRIVGELAEAHRVSLFQISSDGRLLHDTHEWAATPGDRHRPGVLSGIEVARIPTLRVRFDAHRVLTISDPQALPEAVRAELALFSQERRPSASVPLVKGGKIFGALAVYGRPGEVRVWAPELVDALGLAGSILTTALERLRAEEERRRLELQLQHAQKLESLGVLAGGVAHDFNNLLVAILGNLELALSDLPPGSPVRGNLRDAELAAQRAAELTRQMLAYSGRGKLAVEPTNLSKIVEEMLNLLQVSVSKKAALRLSLPAELPTIEADPAQLRQVVMNLVINASEAIGEAPGAIAVTTGLRECSRDELAGSWIDDGLEPGPYVCLEVVDTGCGMEPEPLARIFDPFFTTKFTGRGLGLAAVLGIVRGHRGALEVESTPGKGTTFRVLFPASSRSEREPPRPSPAWRGSGAVLLVDDEEVVRSVGKKMLERLGFEVLLANDGIEAVALFQERAREIVLVVLDLTMPRMDGAETFRELSRLRPGIPIVVSSGYSEQDVEGRFSGDGFAGFLQKPFRMATVSARVRAALEGRR